jgi:hypothetical protein
MNFGSPETGQTSDPQLDICCVPGIIAESLQPHRAASTGDPA